MKKSTKKDRGLRPRGLPGDMEVVSILHGGSTEVSSLLRGIKPYFTYLASFMRRPLSFVRHIDYRDPFVFRNAFVFLSYSVVLYYLTLLPVFIYHGSGIHRVTFYSRTLIQGGIPLVAMHIGIKIVGGRGTWKQTLAAACFSSGFYLPVYALLLLPAHFVLGADFIFGEAGRLQNELAAGRLDILYWFLYYLGVGQLAGIIYLILATRQFEKGVN